MRLLVSMGIRPGGRPNEPLRPLLREVDVDRGEILRDLSWDTEPGFLSGPSADQEFTAASWRDRRTLVQPTHTEILEIDVPRWKVMRVSSHPLFHSVHSAVPCGGGGVVVSSAGNDSVLVLDDEGRLERHHYLPGAGFHERFSGVHDFRRAHHDAFKPHHYHPNYAAFVGDQLWVTCFETRSAGPIGADPLRFRGIPHDGRAIDGRLWFTWVSGQVAVVDPVSRATEIIDVAAMDGRPQRLGWCRGVEVVGDRLFVGMTMLRRTRHREVMRTLLLGAAGEKLPTRIVEVDLRSHRIVREIEVGNAAGGTIYGLAYSP